VELRVYNEGGCEYLPVLDGETKSGKEDRFTCTFWMIQGEKIIADFGLIDVRPFSVRKSHRTGSNRSVKTTRACFERVVEAGDSTSRKTATRVTSRQRREGACVNFGIDFLERFLVFPSRKK
jgi:hypothetical protein